MATTTNFGWETPDDTDLVKDGAAAMRTLGNSIDTSLVDLKGGTTGQILSKASNTDLDYTWINNDQGDITGVTAGTGISGGGTSGDVTITNSMATAIDAKGDLIVGTGADAFSRLAVGTNDQVLTADSSTATGLKWATAASGTTFVGAGIKKTANQSLTNGTFTALSFDSEDFDTNTFHDNSTNNSRMTIPSGKGGYYLVSGLIGFDANATGNRGLELWKNGSMVNQLFFDTPATATNITALPFSYVINVAAADYLQLYGFQNSGGALNVESNQTRFQISYLGA